MLILSVLMALCIILFFISLYIARQYKKNSYGRDNQDLNNAVTVTVLFGIAIMALFFFMLHVRGIL